LHSKTHKKISFNVLLEDCLKLLQLCGHYDERTTAQAVHKTMRVMLTAGENANCTNLLSVDCTNGRDASVWTADDVRYGRAVARCRGWPASGWSEALSATRDSVTDSVTWHVPARSSSCAYRYYLALLFIHRSIFTHLHRRLIVVHLSRVIKAKKQGK